MFCSNPGNLFRGSLFSRAPKSNIMKTCCHFLLFLCLSTMLSAQYSGRVFIDKNNNGQLDTEEQGLENVLVSNGEIIVKTNDEGHFELGTSNRDRFIFITTPNGYRCATFYQPNRGQADDYHFALQEAPITDDFSFIHISDTETSDSTLWVKMLRDYGRHQQPAFIIHTGDICYEPGMRFHAEHVNSSTMGLPVYYTVGNHDLVAGDYGEQLYEELFGPTYYSFEVGKVHFIVTPMLSGDYKPQYTKEDVYRWLDNLLSQLPKDQPKVIFNHDLLRTDEGFVYRINEDEAIDLEAHHLKAWVYGHWHNHFYRRHANSEVKSICTALPNKGGIDHSIAAFRVFNMQADGDFSTQLIHSYVDHQMTIAAPAPKTQLSPSGELTIMVNAYNSTAPADKVTYSLEGKKSQALSPVSDWSWMSQLPISRKLRKKKSLELAVQGTFSDGVIVEKLQQFEITDFQDKGKNGNWPNFLLNAGMRPGQVDQIAPPLQLDWVANVGSNIYHCSPIVADGKVFIASIDDGDAQNCYVYAHDVATGQLLWKSQTRNSIKHAIAYADGLILAADQIGYLYAFEAKDGSLRWERDLELNVLPSYVGGLTTHNGVVYAGDGRRFSAINIENGQLLWQNDEWPQGQGTPAPPSIGNGVILASSNWRHLYAFEVKTGKPLWNNTEHGLRFRNAAPAFYDGAFYTTSKSALFKIAPQTGKVLLMTETDYNLNASASPAVTKDLIIIGTTNAGIRAFDRRTFQEVWHFETAPAMTVSVPYSGARVKTVAASPVISDGRVYVGGLDGNFYCLDAKSGKKEWSLALGAPIFSTVSITDGRIYLADFGGNLYAFR